MSLLFQSFPEFNIWSTSLLILVLQALVFVILLFLKFRKSTNISYFLLALLLFITCYHRTTWTIGFMGWYDTYRNTKINYFLIPLGLSIGPLIFFYLKSITTSDFKFKRQYWWHFTPVMVMIIYRVSILLYDSMQPGFEDSQNGILMNSVNNGAVGIFLDGFTTIHKLLYLAFSFQLFFRYRKQIKQFFSNTFRLELHWASNFLFVYAFLFIYGVMQNFVDTAVFEMTWIQKWWKDFLSALAVLYLGIKGYYTPTDKLNGLQFDAGPIKNSKPSESRPSLKKESEALLLHMQTQKPFLNPELNLNNLADELGITRSQLSETINAGLHKNFNDFINEYRVEEFKAKLKTNSQEKLSLLGIAYECGFNSKATFNRVFKRITNYSPSQYIQQTS